MTNPEQAVKRAEQLARIKEALDLGLQAWRTTPVRDKFLAAHREADALAAENERLREALDQAADEIRRLEPPRGDYLVYAHEWDRAKAIEAAARELADQVSYIVPYLDGRKDAAVEDALVALRAALAADHSGGSELKWKSGAVEVGIEPTLDTGEAS